MNIRVIAVVDDDPSNRKAAARAIRKVLPRATVLEFSTAAEVITLLSSGQHAIELVFTDLSMEDETAGLRVAAEAWSWNIPAVIVTGGINHDRKYVAVGYPRATYYYCSKNSTETWLRILEGVLEKTASNAILRAFAYGRRATPDRKFGRVCAVAAGGLL